jgi:hypothetical protein
LKREKHTHLLKRPISLLEEGKAHTHTHTHLFRPLIPLLEEGDIQQSICLLVGRVCMNDMELT